MYNGQLTIVVFPSEMISISRRSRHLHCPLSILNCQFKNTEVFTMDFYKVPIGFGMALAQNTAAMNHYAHLSEDQKQDILDKAHNVRSEKEMYTLVASLANGW